MKEDLNGFTKGLVLNFLSYRYAKQNFLTLHAPFIHILNLHRHQQNQNLSPEILQKCQCAFLPGLC